MPSIIRTLRRGRQAVHAMHVSDYFVHAIHLTCCGIKGGHYEIHGESGSGSVIDNSAHSSVGIGSVSNLHKVHMYSCRICRLHDVSIP